VQLDKNGPALNRAGLCCLKVLIAPIEGKMSNVVPLFKQETIDNHPTDDSNNSLPIAIADIMASKDHLACAVEELSRHLDAAGRAIDALGDTDPRSGIAHAAKLNRERLTKAMLELSQAAEKLSSMEQELTEAVARRPGHTANQDQLETVADGQQKS
jgi:hypothetical protein